MQKRILWLDILRVISIIAIITLHVIGNTINTFNLTGSSKDIYEVIKYICYSSIPIFVMISGALFLNQDIPLKKMFTKYILRIFLALLFFGFFYSLLEVYFTTKTLTLTSITISLKNILTGNLWAHMWYLYLILGLYLITPIIRTITKNISLSTLKYFLLISYLFNILIPELSTILNIQIAFYIPLSNTFLFYYLYGYYLTHHEISPKYTFLTYTLGLISLCTIIYLTLTTKSSEYLTYTSSLIFFLASAIYLYFKNKNLKLNPKFTQLLNSLNTCSFGIYLIHQLFINIIYKLLKFDLILKFPLGGLISYTLIILLISYLTTYILKKIPYLNKYLI